MEVGVESNVWEKVFCSVPRLTRDVFTYLCTPYVFTRASHNMSHPSLYFGQLLTSRRSTDAMPIVRLMLLAGFHAACYRSKFEASAIVGVSLLFVTGATPRYHAVI